MTHATHNKNKQSSHRTRDTYFSKRKINTTSQQSLHGKIPSLPNFFHCFTRPERSCHDRFHTNTMNEAQEKKVGQIKNIEGTHHRTTHCKTSCCHQQAEHGRWWWQESDDDTWHRQTNGVKSKLLAQEHEVTHWCDRRACLVYIMP